MSQVFKVLAQAAGDGTDLIIYTVPADTMAIVSAVVVSNNTANPVVGALRVRKAGAVSDPQELLYSIDADTQWPVDANQTRVTQFPITLDEGDHLILHSAIGAKCNAFGVEIAK